MSLYLELMKICLLDLHRVNQVEYKPIHRKKHSLKRRILLKLDNILSKKKMAICDIVNYQKENRINGLDWPTYADSMIGLKRMENIEYCVNKVIEDKIPGDLIETGVWKGGATIFMAALLKESNVKDRKIWVADSFEGLPRPDEDKYIYDKGDTHYLQEELSVSLETVKNNFKKYNLLDDNICFLKGWFKDTLPSAPIQSLAILRLDGDMYESTIDSLVYLYPKLAKGGFIIVDDWGAVPACKQAVLDYREQHNILDEIIDIDGIGVFWRKSGYA
ncbi:MAG: TylF/MycF/NovP-related O-methyltransferase [Haliscomenobacter sp.]|uniref:TylF/MycF/NovP-related O-methyltransferase n=1 Tax=Haliscomenobacter sp. TaxID=2717303 RepID=UPI0029BDA58A|nr:TylF/MycF/NovP-related O-methyltransferase [Haliscomenobacter sp.]MDX2067860.1 TylF/MycF/NovP-related O-methyltransferase [Haliscomenobacter sp.]